MASYADVPHFSPEELKKKFRIPVWFRDYEIRLEWENFKETTVATPVAFGGTIEKSYYYMGEKCFMQLDIRVARFRQTFRKGTVVQYLYIKRNAVARLLLKISRSGIQQLNKTAGAAIGPNKKEIVTVSLELLSAFRGTPVGNVLAEMIKADDALKLLDKIREISDMLEKDRKDLDRLVSVTKLKLSETKDVEELVSLVQIDPLTRTLTLEIPCDDWIRKLEEGVLGKRDDEPLDDTDIKPGQSPEELLEDLLKKAWRMKP